MVFGRLNLRHLVMPTLQALNHQVPVPKKANLLPRAILRLLPERLSLPEALLTITKTNRFPLKPGKTRQPWRERILFWKEMLWVLKKSRCKTPDIFGLWETAVTKKGKISGIFINIPAIISPFSMFLPEIFRL